ncbi:MAG: ABC transporter permease, partial [Leeuwenhoekiella sp.]
MAKQANSLTQLALQKFKRNFWGVLSFIFIVFIGLLAVFAYMLAPDDSENANQMHLSIHSQKPGFTVTMLRIPGDTVEQNWLDRYFTGVKDTGTEIPISEFTLHANILEYIP